MAVAVKFLPAVLAPLYWRRVRIRDGMLAALLVGLMYFPFVNHGTIPFGSLGVFVQRFRFNDPIFAGIERAIRPQMAAGIAVLSGLFTAVWIRSRWPSPPREAWSWPMALSLAAAPVVYPWYLLWLLPFMLPAAFTLPLAVWTLSILPVFFVWYSYALGGPWQVPNWVLWLEYGSAAIAAIIVFIRWRCGPETCRRRS
jgi:hypothetical protein